MYDELIERLREPCQYENCILCQQAADAIENLICELADEHNARLDAEKVPRWIPVSERLPEKGERVLCYCRANIYEVMVIRTDGAWVHNDSVYSSSYMSGFVTHWMPLPEPPEEET